MLKYPVVRGLIAYACGKSERFNRVTQSIKNTFHNRISSNLHPNIINTVDKIIYIFEVQLPIIILLSTGFGVSVAMGLALKDIAVWLVPSVLWAVYDSIAMTDIYPYDYLKDMTEMASNDAYDHLDLDQETIDFVNEFSKHFKKQEINNVILHGPTGSGKISTCEALAKIVNDPRLCPEHLKGHRVYRLSLEELLALGSSGMSSSVETRLISVLEILQMRGGKTIVVIPKIQRIMESSEGRTSIINLLKTYLTRGFMKVLGETTSVEAAKTIAQDKAAKRRFNPVKMSVMSNEKCLKIVEKKFKGKCTFNSGALNYALMKADALSTRSSRPGNVIDLLETAFVKRPESKKNEPLTVGDIDVAIKSIQENNIRRHPHDWSQVIIALNGLNAKFGWPKDPEHRVRHVSPTLRKAREEMKKHQGRPRSHSSVGAY